MRRTATVRVCPGGASVRTGDPVLTTAKVTLVPMSNLPHGAGEHVGYTERLRTPWWWYLAAVAVALLLGAEFALAVSGWVTWVPLLILVPACVGVVWRMSGGRLDMTDSELTAGDATLELNQVQQAIALSATELRRLVGRHGDPTAHVFIRSWIGPGVQLVLPTNSKTSDESDTVPYWVVSTRHPDRLLAALKAASVRTV
jgi:hypothetical protein